MDTKSVEPLPFEVVGNTIFVEFLIQENVTQSGIVLQESTKRPYEVVVIGVGPEVAEDVAQVGDVLIVKKHEVSSVIIGRDEREVYYLKSYDTILGRVVA